jgi:hypothetical protein
MQVVATLQIKVFLHGLEISDHASVRYYLQHYLQKGWFWGRPVDLSDTQWRDFRGSLGPLSAAMAAFVTISYMVSLRILRTLVVMVQIIKQVCPCG